MEIVKALGDLGLVIGTVAIVLAPRIGSLFLAMRRKE